MKCRTIDAGYKARFNRAQRKKEKQEAGGVGRADVGIIFRRNGRRKIQPAWMGSRLE